MDNEEATLKEDLATIHKLAAIGKYFDKLKAFEQEPSDVVVAAAAAPVEREPSAVAR
jgi:hypothetical protein